MRFHAKTRKGLRAILRRSLPILLATGLATAGRSDVYECKTTHFGNGGWIGNGYILAFDREAVAGSVYGWAIHEVHQTPIPVDVRNPSPIRWEFRYSVSGVKPTNSGSTKVSYKVVLNTRTNRFLISGRLHGSDNNISGSGTCKRVK